MEYKTHLIEAINNLYEARILIFEQILNFGMSTEMAHLADAYEPGDLFPFDMAMFEEIEDVNIQKMIELCKKADETLDFLMNVNKLSENEVNFY